MLSNSALAVALIGLSSSPARADATLFREITGVTNPVNGLNPGSLSTPALGDLDGDGDLDLVAGRTVGGTFSYYENTGDANSPAFVLRTGAADPWNGFNAGPAAAPVLADLDADGDLDFICGTASGSILYLRNTGSALTPAFVPTIFFDNPFFGLSAGPESFPALADLDGDGDLDLFAGNVDGVFVYFRNVGNANGPFFTPITGSQNPLDGVDIGSYSVPRLGDLDGDGDLDLIVGERYGAFLYYENAGLSIHTPTFIARTGIANPLAGHDVGFTATTALGDLDADGDLDLVGGNASGPLHYFQNQTGKVARQTGTSNPLNGFSVGETRSASALGDLDGDGDLDLLSGKYFGTFAYFENTSTASSPAFIQRTGASNPLDGQDVGVGSSVPALGDLDGDGDLDMISGESTGTFFFYKNTGNAFLPAFSQQNGAANPMNGQDIGFNSTPALADVDGDGDLDLVVGEQFGTFAYFENTGNPASPAFLPRAGGANPFNGFDVGTRSKPALRDFDGDGDLDLVSGEAVGGFFYFENTGTPNVPNFVARSGSSNPLDGLNGGFGVNYSAPALADFDGDGDGDVVSGNGVGSFDFYENAIVRPSPRHFGPSSVPFGSADVGFFSSPAAGDLDGDGDSDFIVGTSFGNGAIHYFQNTGSAALPRVVERTGSSNPFNGLSAGTFGQFALGDIDSDGDLDLVVGENYGNPLHFFVNTGTATAPAFVERTGLFNLFGAVVVGRGVPAFGDVDGDGDLDLVVGDFYGNFRYFQNVGSARVPNPLERTGALNPFNGLSAANFSAPVLGDLDRDGDLDLLAGRESPGTFHYFANTGTARVPAFVERTGSANPLDGKSVGLNSRPAFVDLDGDGDLDVVSGERYGTLSTYYLPEPGLATLLGWGAGLLAWLAGAPRRR